MTETDLGQIAALLALACALYSMAAAILGAGWPGAGWPGVGRPEAGLPGARRPGLDWLRVGWPARPALVASARRGVVATGLLVALMTGSLLYALWTHDFAVKYVAEYSNLEVARVFDLSSLWAGQAGSLMFWCLLLNIYAVVALYQNRGGRNAAFMPWVIAILMAYQVFFLFLIDVVVDSPWQRLTNPPADGAGLMPLLQNPTMLIHPPMLYLGYVAFSIPFAFGLAALITGRLGDEWLTTVRRWTLLAWFFLGCGLLLGGNWAYNELGWGGYWAWDPVENVALMPWLTGTAFLHSIMIQQRRGMLKVWNLALVIATFCLTLFGTFMNRSGIASSVHAFEGSALGLPFVVLISATLLISCALLYLRLPRLGASNHLDAFLSRESAFLMNNLLLVGLAFAVFWGTIFPILSEALRGAAGKVTVGAPFFNKVTGPLFLALLLFMAIGPLLPWRKAAPENLRRNLLRPLAAGVVCTVLGVVLTRNAGAALSFGLCAAVVAAVAVDFYRGAAAKHRATGYTWPRALIHLVDGNHGRYGGYIVHLGIALVALGVTGSTLLKTDVQGTLRFGQSMAVGPYVVTPTQPSQGTVPGVGPYWAANVRVTRDGQPVATLAPRLVLYQSQGQAIAQIALQSSPLEDIYVTMGQPSADLSAVRLHVLINPLLWWVWAGGLVVIAGGIIAFTPSVHERRARIAVSAGVPATAR